MEIKKILVPIDGSDASKSAVEYGVAMAKAHAAELLLVSIADVNSAAYPIMGVTLDKYGFANIKKQAEQLIALAKASVPEDVNCTTRVETGIPGSAIASIVEDEKVDMVIMGNSGKGAVSSFVMGSVSQYVIHHVKCPVLVVK